MSSCSPRSGTVPHHRGQQRGWPQESGAAGAVAAPLVRAQVAALPTADTRVIQGCCNSGSALPTAGCNPTGSVATDFVAGSGTGEVENATLRWIRQSRGMAEVEAGTSHHRRVPAPLRHRLGAQLVCHGGCPPSWPSKEGEGSIAGGKGRRR